MKRLLQTVCVLLVLILGCQGAFAAGAALTETVVTPPQLAGKKNYPVAVIPHAGGTVDYFTVLEPENAPRELRRYQSRDGGKNWTEIPCKWAPGVMKAYSETDDLDLRVEDIYLADNGACYMGLLDKDDRPHFIEAQPNGSFKELPMPAWETEHDGVQIHNVTVTKAGDWAFSYYPLNGVAFMETIDRKTGKLKQRVIDGEQGWDCVICGDLALAGGLSNYFSFYDMSTGKRLRDVKLPRNDTEWRSYETAITLDETGAAYMVSRHGLERMAPGGSVLETILEGSRCYLGDKNASLRKFRKQPGADVFYVVMHLDDQFRLCRYGAGGAN